MFYSRSARGGNETFQMEIACSNAFSRRAAKPARDLVALKRNVTQRSGAGKLAFMAFKDSCDVVQCRFYFSLRHPAYFARISRLAARPSDLGGKVAAGVSGKERTEGENRTRCGASSKQADRHELRSRGMPQGPSRMGVPGVAHTFRGGVTRRRNSSPTLALPRARGNLYR